jgi:demethylmenaquinone methyltransferase/2-methoxy-6-polyprenyl-1,4-benzoquinol methylase
MSQGARVRAQRSNGLTFWREVEDALEAIIKDYERVNHIISLFQDDRARLRGLGRVGAQEGVILELGSGPGNFTRMLRPIVDGFIVCLDYSDKMIQTAVIRNREEVVGFVRGIFEALPFKGDTVSFAAAAYALRDSTDKARVLQEVNSVLKDGGKLLIVDIGKPNNPVVRGFFSLYMRYVVPVIGGLVTGRGYRNPWSLLYKTYRLLPANNGLLTMLTRIVGQAELEELALGGLVVAVAEKSSGH